MISVGIATLTGEFNFGNRLQNFALQEALKALGVARVETILSAQRSGEGGSKIARRAEQLRREGLKGAASRIARRTGLRPTPPPTHRLGAGREHAIHNFVKERIHETEFDYSHPEDARKLAADYDFFIAGSDQIWNPQFGLRDHLRFLEFAQSHQRVAYAASFGVPSIPRRLEGAYRSGILGMADVSVREQRASDLVRELTGREVPVVLDPTMLLRPQDWQALAATPSSLSEGGYVAEFFLGSASAEELLPATTFATRRGLEIVDLKSDPRADLASIGPLEFIGAIKNASLLVTDSFHAAVFATIFSVPYLLKGRGAMNSRFDTLLSKSGLPIPRWTTLKELEASTDIDWQSVRENLERERTSSLAFLRNALPLETGD